MPLQATSGAASYDAFGGGVAAVPQYIEDVFSTYLYTGNGSTQTITNGIDLAGKGGLVWSKSRSNIENHVLLDTIRGPNNILSSNLTSGGSTSGTPYVTATTTGYSIGTSNNQINGSGLTYASWTFREQPKFFDVVTFTENTAGTQTISHSLGATPACIILKVTSRATDWYVYHTSLGTSKTLNLNSTSAEQTLTSVASVSSTDFGVAMNNIGWGIGTTWVAYVFASNAGGFGLTGTDNVISCGSYTGNGSAQTISLGYEPQWVMIKSSSLVDTNWTIFDSMRGIVTATGVSGDAALVPNTSNAEVATDALSVTATGFIAETNATHYNRSGQTYIYIAIRRGPMKVPTSGTSVFDADAYTGNSTARVITTGFPSDLNIMANRTSDGLRSSAWDRLRGFDKFLATSNASIDVTYANEAVYFDNNSGYGLSTSTSQGLVNFSGYGGYVGWAFRRAPSFFDEVCYRGTGSARTISHNLGVAPELMIVKARESAGGGARNWAVYASSLGAGTQAFLSTTDAAFASTTIWGNTSPTASVFSVSTNVNTNYSAVNYVAYLFATCAGVSKVGSYTGNGSSQTINCGFTGGARFVLIKRTDSTGDWYVWDSARGIVVGNDPHLSLNTSSAEVTTDDTIDTNSTGFVVNQVVATNVNVTSATYIFLAIA